MLRRTTTHWLAAATAADGGLLIPALRPKQTADLLLRSDAAAVRAGTDEVALAWADHWRGALGVMGSAWLPTTVSPGDTAHRWTLSHWYDGRYQAHGVAIEVHGCYVEATGPLRDRGGWRGRIDRWGVEGAKVPLAHSRQVNPLLVVDRTIVAVLCTVLATRPELRPRLDDPFRVRRLIADVVSHRHDEVRFRQGYRRGTMEILNTLRLAGYEHTLAGRPLPDEVMPPLDELVATVRARIAANPYANDLVLDEATVRHVIDQRYVSVDPWPIQALLD